MGDQRNKQAAKPHASKALSRKFLMDVLPDDALLKELTKAARKEIKPALISDGATDEKAERAIVKIGYAVASFRTERQRGVDAVGEIMNLAKVLSEAQVAIAKLTPSAHVVLSGCFRQFDKTKFEDIERALPDVLVALIPSRGKSGAHDRELDSLVKETATIWRSASGQWPTGGHVRHKPTSKLYCYLRENCRAHLTSAIWGRALQTIRKTSGAANRPPGRRKK